MCGGGYAVIIPGDFSMLIHAELCHSFKSLYGTLQMCINICRLLFISHFAFANEAVVNTLF